MKLIRVGVDLAKNVFQVHGVDRNEKAVWCRAGVLAVSAHSERVRSELGSCTANRIGALDLIAGDCKRFVRRGPSKYDNCIAGDCVGYFPTQVAGIAIDLSEFVRETIHASRPGPRVARAGCDCYAL